MFLSPLFVWYFIPFVASWGILYFLFAAISRVTNWTGRKVRGPDGKFYERKSINPTTGKTYGNDSRLKLIHVISFFTALALWFCLFNIFT